MSKKAAEYFLNGVKAQNPVSLQKYKTDEDMGYIAILKPGNVIDNDVLATGDVLLVTDSSNNVAPFLNPFRIDDIINDNQEFVSELPHINCKVKKKKI